MKPMEQRSWAAAYHISFSELEEGSIFAQKDLDQDSKLLFFLNSFAHVLHSPALQVTGSLFIKRYGLFIAGAMHGFMRNRETIDLSPERIKLVWKKPGLHFIVEYAEVPPCLSGLQDDGEKRTRYFDHMFADQICPMLRRVAQVTHIDEETLWGTLSYSLNYWKNDWLQDYSLSEKERQRIEEDFSELWSTFRQERFPHMAFNPLNGTFRSVDNPWDQDKPVLVRSKCCLHYCLPLKDGYCYTCPKISDKRRIEKYGEAHGKTNKKE